MATDGNILDVPPGIFPDPSLATAIASFRASLGEDVESKLVKGGEEGFTDQVCAPSRLCVRMCDAWSPCIAFEMHSVHYEASTLSLMNSAIIRPRPQVPELTRSSLAPSRPDSATVACGS